MSKILIVYSTTDGHTKRICEKLARVIEGAAHEADVVPIENAGHLDMTGFDKIVLGASIRYGKHSPRVYDFVGRHQALLDEKPNAFFSVNVVARKPDKNNPATNPYLKKFLGQISWQPKVVAVFAGKIDYPRYRFWDRQMIRLIMWMTKGPTDRHAVIEFTDWKRVQAFGELVARM